MSNSNIHKQLQNLRKEKGLTQEELAEVFGVTNQAVSKWENGACFPDTAILPDIADYFGVSIDTLFGRKKAGGCEEIVKDIKGLFHGTPVDECFSLACEIAFYLHEGVVSKGYKGYLPWDTNKALDPGTWGTSICSEPEGVTVAKQGMIFLSNQKIQRNLSPEDILNLWSEVQKYANADRLTVLFTLYELTRWDFDLFVGIEEIVDKAGLDEKVVREAFKHMPIHHKRLDNGSIGYRIEGSNMHIPSLLTLFVRTH